MLIDAHNMFSDAQDVTVSAESDNVVDLLAARRGAGEKLQIACNVQTTFVGGTSIAVSLQSSAAAAFGSYTTHWTGPAIGVASLAAGYRFELPDLPDDIARYVRLYYTVVGTFTAGYLDAALVKDKQSNHYDAIKSQYDAINA